MISTFFKFLSGIYYGWRMVGLVSTIRVLGGGLHQYGFTVFFLPISQDLGLSRAATSLAFSLARAEGAIEGPVVGYLVDRHGPRPMIMVAAVLTGIGYILLSWVDSYASFLIIYLGVISLAFTAGFVHSPMVVANSWFIRRRARAMTLISAAVPVGGAMISPLLAMAVYAWGWRWAAFLAGCLFLFIAAPLSVRLRRSPESIGLLPDGDPPQKGAPRSAPDKSRAPGDKEETDFTVRHAMSTFVYWMLVLSMMARVGAYSTVSVHFVPIMVWKGLSQEQAALFLGAFAFLNLLSHFLLGWIADMMNKLQLLTACMFIAAASVLALMWGEAYWLLWLFTILFTVIDASFPIAWAAVGDFFGRRYFATIRGTMSFFYQWGSVIGPVLAGAIYDQSQTYHSVLWGLFVLLLISSFLNALLIKPWADSRKRLLALSS
ncbi:MAG TPA: MFS transporter [Candidatus Binatia bacterium]|nr:MFS transporter [Candidatus Binatia bacterium]